MRDISMRVGIVLALLTTVACGGTTPVAQGTTAAAQEVGADRRLHPALDAMRVPGWEALFERLEHDPRDVDALVDGAVAYAPSRARGMTLVWGAMARLLAPDGPRTAEVTAAMRTALEQGIERRAGGGSVSFAPGAVPVLAFPDGRFVPFVHRFELTTALSGGDGQTLDGAATVFGGYPRFAAEAPMGGARTELATYLGTLRAAGLLEAYAHWVVGPAYGPEFDRYRLVQEPNVEAMWAHLRAHPFEPTVAVRPDDLVRMR